MPILPKGEKTKHEYTNEHSQAQIIETRPIRFLTDARSDGEFVKNSSFLSRDIESLKGNTNLEKIESFKKEEPMNVNGSPSNSNISPPNKCVPSSIKSESPPKKSTSSPNKRVSPPNKVVSPPNKVATLLIKTTSPPNQTVSSLNSSVSPPKASTCQPIEKVSPPSKILPPPIKGVTTVPIKEVTSSKKISMSREPFTDSSYSPAQTTNVLQSKEATTTPIADNSLSNVTSSPPSAFKVKGTAKADSTTVNSLTKESSKEVLIKTDKLSLTTNKEENIDKASQDNIVGVVEKVDNKIKETVDVGEANGVGDKIKKFEKAAEDASATANKKRSSSIQGRPRSERIGSDSKEDYLPPATPFKDNVHFELSTPTPTDPQSNKVSNAVTLERQHSLSRNNESLSSKWQKQIAQSFDADKIRKPEPQKIIKPEFKTIQSPVDVTIRSPSLGTKIGDQFPSHGTAFRNVASPDSVRCKETHKLNDDVNTQNNLKTCKFKTKEKYSVSKGSSYFTRGSEEIWLVKKKDIEEIEERVLDSFRRAGGNICVRNDVMRPSSDSGPSVSFTHATMGRNKRQMYSRSESLDPQSAGARAQTLKRQSSVACTCGHDKKVRAKSSDAVARPRSKSHGDENNQAHVLDKYETLV